MQSAGFQMIREQTVPDRHRWSVLILTILTTGGIVFCLQWMFQGEMTWLPAIFLTLLSGILFEWLDHSPGRYLAGCGVTVVILAVGAVVGHRMLLAGAMDFLNQVIAQYNYVTGGAVDYFVVPEYKNMTLAYVSVLSYFVILLTAYMRRVIAGKHSLIVLLCWLPVLVGGIYLQMPLTGILGSCAAASIVGTYAYSRMEVQQDRIYAVSLLVLLGILAAAGSIYYQSVDYKPSERIAGWKEAVGDKVEQARFGGSDYPEGDLSKPVNTSEDSRLEVTLSGEARIYLKGYTGSIFQKNRWQGLPPTDYSKRYEGMIKNYVRKGFHPLAQLNCYINASAGIRGAGFDQTEIQVRVKNTGAFGKYTYLPYGVSFRDLEKLPEIYQDVNAAGSGENDTQSYVVNATAQDALIRYDGAAWLDQKTDPNEGAGNFRVAESDYREFVKKRYLSLSRRESQEYETLLGQKLTDLSEITDKIRLTLSKLGEQEDGWSSADYASAGTLMYRWFSVPARYVEGYLVQGKGTVSVTAKDAHAWVEIYKDGVGWIPVDVTPGYYQELPQQEHRSKQPQSVSGQQQVEQTAPQKQKTDENAAASRVILWIILLIIVILALLFVGVLWIYRQIIWKRRVREMEQDDISDRIRCLSGYMAQMYQYLERPEEELEPEVRDIFARLWYASGASARLGQTEFDTVREAVRKQQWEIWKDAGWWKKQKLRYWYRLEYPAYENR